MQQGPAITDRGGRLLEWLTVAQDEITKGHEWPRWALDDFMTHPKDRTNFRRYMLFTFLVKNGLPPERAGEWMWIQDYRNGTVVDVPLARRERKDAEHIAGMITRAITGQLYETAPRMQDMQLGRPDKAKETK